MDYHWGYGGAKKERRGRRADLPEEVAKKLKSCSVMGCEEWRDLAAPTTYHCFPTGDKNQQRWEIWTSLLQKAREDENWIPFRGSLVCSHHFKSTDFVQDPHQKRTKLVKNAIPSIFPTFTVDLEDPSYFLEDSEDDSAGAVGAVDANDEGDYNNGYYDNDNYAGGDEGEYSYEDYHQDQDEETDMVMPEVQMQYEDDEEESLDQEYEAFSNPPQKQYFPPKTRPLPTLTPATNFRNSQEYQPPKKKAFFNTGIVGQGNVGGSASTAIMSKKPPLTFKGALKSNPRNNGVTTSSVPTTSFENSSTSKLYQELCKTAPNGRVLSYKDLEIEVVDGISDDSIPTLKQRIEDLVTENETLKQKFGAQIRALQRKIKEQEKIILERKLVN